MWSSLKKDSHAEWLLVVPFLLTLARPLPGEEATALKKEMCDLEDLSAVRKTYAPHEPQWFFRPFSIQDRVAYAGPNSNYFLDLASGKEIPIPGPYDPVPTADEKTLTVPEGGGLTFYSVDDLDKGNSTPLFVDDKLKGVYQSIGNVGNDTVRIITDQDGLSFRDYEIVDKKVTALGTGPKKLCAGLRLSLPMLSKDGKQIAALDVAAGVTKIFDIDPATGNCNESLNLGFATGKVDFSFNGDDLTFHVINNENQEGNYFSTPSDSMVANVYLFKRSTKELARLTQNVDSNSVYPSFRKDGTISYLHHPNGTNKSLKQASFVIADPKRVQGMSADFLNQTPNVDPAREQALHASAAIGALWSRLCSPFGKEISAGSAALLSRSLDQARCRELVELHWEAEKTHVLENEALVKSVRIKKDRLEALTEEELLNACPKTSRDNSPMQEVGEGSVKPEDMKAQFPVKACAECHPHIPFDDLAKLREMTATNGKPFVDEILDRIDRTDEGTMPPYFTLSATEKAAIRRFLSTAPAASSERVPGRPTVPPGH